MFLNCFFKYHDPFSFFLTVFIFRSIFGFSKNCLSFFPFIFFFFFQQTPANLFFRSEFDLKKTDFHFFILPGGSKKKTFFHFEGFGKMFFEHCFRQWISTIPRWGAAFEAVCAAFAASFAAVAAVVAALLLLLLLLLLRCCGCCCFCLLLLVCFSVVLISRKLRTHLGNDNAPETQRTDDPSAEMKGGQQRECWYLFRHSTRRRPADSSISHFASLGIDSHLKGAKLVRVVWVMLLRLSHKGSQSS